MDCFSLDNYPFFSTISTPRQSKLIPLAGLENVCQIQANNKYQREEYNQNCFNLQCELPFGRSENIKMFFKIDNTLDKHFYFGIASLQDVQRKNQLCFESGIQICLNCDGQHSSKEIQLKGIKKAKEVFKNGQIYKAEIQVQKNLLIISDINSEYIVESNCVFEEIINEWVIIFGDQGWQKGTQFTLEIL